MGKLSRRERKRRRREGRPGHIGRVNSQARVAAQTDGYGNTHDLFFEREKRGYFGRAKEKGRGSGYGPEKWCANCGRKHPRRAVCKLFLRERVAKSGRVVRRWAA